MVNDIALNGSKDADTVNYFEYTIFKGDIVNYHNSWVTDITISKDNIIQLVKGGRARCKIENEAFNTLKNQGYHLEHNFGHSNNIRAWGRATVTNRKFKKIYLKTPVFRDVFRAF